MSRPTSLQFHGRGRGFPLCNRYRRAAPPCAAGAGLGQVYSQLHAHDEHIALADVRATAEVLHEVVTSYLTDV